MRILYIFELDDHYRGWVYTMQVLAQSLRFYPYFDRKTEGK